ncbi:MAG: CopG family antitoxin [Chloroflexota bacterium]|nr:CopG family antitoxin [Chloroflexota bacterium]
MSETKKQTRIPTFNSPEEEAEFWDTHDTADFEDEFERTEVRFAKNLSQGITVRFTAETLETLRATAQRKGIGPTTLARMWILERLEAIDQGTAAP